MSSASINTNEPIIVKQYCGDYLGNNKENDSLAFSDVIGQAADGRLYYQDNNNQWIQIEAAGTHRSGEGFIYYNVDFTGRTNEQEREYDEGGRAVYSYRSFSQVESSISQFDHIDAQDISKYTPAHYTHPTKDNKIKRFSDTIDVNKDEWPDNVRLTLDGDFYYSNTRVTPFDVDPALRVGAQ